MGHVDLMQMPSKVPMEIPYHLSTIDNETAITIKCSCNIRCLIEIKPGI